MPFETPDSHFQRRDQQQRDADLRAQVGDAANRHPRSGGSLRGFVATIQLWFMAACVGIVALAFLSIGLKFGIPAGVHAVKSRFNSSKPPPHLVAGSLIGETHLTTSYWHSWRAFSVPAKEVPGGSDGPKFESSPQGVVFSPGVELHNLRIAEPTTPDDPCAGLTYFKGGDTVLWWRDVTQTLRLCARVKSPGGYSDSLLRITATPDHQYTSVRYTTWVGKRS